MTEPTWKDELCEIWWRDCCEDTRNAMVHTHRDRNALFVLESLTGSINCLPRWERELEDVLGADADRLRSLIDAELARGREAVEVLRGCVTFGRPCPWCEWDTALHEKNHGHSPDCRLAKLIGEKP
jgi:hypothetical protein